MYLRGEGCLSCEQQRGDRSIRTNLNRTYIVCYESRRQFFNYRRLFLKLKKSFTDLRNRISKKVINVTIVVILFLTAQVD